jgi:hypothetical protein
LLAHDPQGRANSAQTGNRFSLRTIDKGQSG